MSVSAFVNGWDNENDSGPIGVNQSTDKPVEDRILLLSRLEL